MDRAPTFYEAHNLAQHLACMHPLASKCTTPAAVRVRVKLGHMHPDAFTVRGGALWTAEGVQRELAHERRLQLDAIRLGIKDGNTSALLQRRANREPRQLRLDSAA